MKKWLLSLVLLLLSPFFFVGISSAVAFEASLEESLPIYQDKSLVEDQVIASPSYLNRQSQLILLLLFLAGLTYLCMLFLRGLRKPREKAKQNTLASFRILAEQDLGKNKRLIVAEIYSQLVLLSESNYGFQFLYEIKDQEIKDRILLDFSTFLTSKERGFSESFLQVWRGHIKHLKCRFSSLSGGQGKDEHIEEKRSESGCLQDKELSSD